jgi:hypothetical protein
MPQSLRTDYCAKNPQFIYIMRCINTVHTFIQYFLNIHFKIVLPSLPVPPAWLHLLVNILVVVSTSPVHATWITQLILNFISPMFCEKYRLWKLLFKHFFPWIFKRSPWHCSQTPSVCLLPLTLWQWNFAPSISCKRQGI